MTTTQNRPALARQHTRKTEENRKADLELGVKISHDGRDYVVRVGDITATLARRFRREVGCSFRAVMEELNTDPDIDSVSAVIWMCRLIEGEEIAYDDVAFDYGDLDEVEVAEATEGDDSDPEA